MPCATSPRSRGCYSDSSGRRSAVPHLLYAHLAGAGQDRILDLAAHVVGHARVLPRAALLRLFEDLDLHRVGAELLVEDEDIELVALAGRFGRRVPVGQDDAAERIGAGQRHERDRIERGAPQEAIDADAGIVLLVLAGTEDVRAVAEDARFV